MPYFITLHYWNLFVRLPIQLHCNTLPKILFWCLGVTEAASSKFPQPGDTYFSVRTDCWNKSSPFHLDHWECLMVCHRREEKPRYPKGVEVLPHGGGHISKDILQDYVPLQPRPGICQQKCRYGSINNPWHCVFPN